HHGAGRRPVGPPQPRAGPVIGREEDGPARLDEWPRRRAGGGVERVVDVLDEESLRLRPALLAGGYGNRRHEREDKRENKGPRLRRDRHRWFSLVDVHQGVSPSDATNSSAESGTNARNSPA